ncbi:MAG TPA: DUF4388 domain-containing protein [Thermodesulfovibrionales bacterium]|jgi:curved DNA-binding protein CbpA|nr:DUF4388 domain-containing protein [Thermodesulfovibrionales bacterium]
MSKDHRHFRRYKTRHPAKISLPDRDLDAEIVDYSLGGVGIVYGDGLQLQEGDILRIGSDLLDLDARCAVEWWSQSTGEIRAGLRKIDPLRGSLRHYLLPDIFIGLQRSLKTGIFDLKSGNIEKKIYIKNGDLIFATSNLEEDRLGDILLREGKITRSQFDRSAELIRQTGKRQGSILVELGAISPQELWSTVKQQVADIILSLFEFSEGDFIFLEGNLPTDEVIILKLSAGNLIYRGIKRSKSLVQAKDYLALGSESVISFSGNPLDLFQDISLDDEDKRILSFVDGKRTSGEIIQLAGLDKATGQRSVAALLSTSIVEVSHGGDVEQTVTPDHVIDASVPPPNIGEKIERMIENCRSLNYYSLFGIEESAPDPKIQWAFYRLAKEFHPDRHFYLGEDMKGKLHTIFSTVTKAYGVLSSPERRRDYDRSLSGGQRTSSQTEEACRKFKEGLSAVHRKDFLQASELFDAACRLDESAPEYYFHYGLSLIELNRLHDAARAMTRASNLAPHNDKVFAELGSIYLALGFPMRARRYFKKALDLNSENRAARKGLEESGQPRRS